MKNNSCNRTFSSNSARDDYQRKMSAVRSFASSSASASGEKHRHHVSLINGSNRGIGLAFAKHLLETNNESIVGDKRTNGTVIATCRNPDEAKDLHVRHYPTVYYYHSGDKPRHEEYDGHMETDAFTDFLTERTGKSPHKRRRRTPHMEL